MTRSSWLVALLLGFVGLGANALPLTLFFRVDIIFGSVATLLVTAWFGWRHGLLATLIAGGYTLKLWGHPYAFGIFLAETVCVAMLLRRRGLDLITADAVFWLTVGMPLVLLLYGGVMQLDSSATLLIMLKQAVNGITNAFFASVLARAIPPERLGAPPRQKLAFDRWLSTPVAGLVLLPCIVLTLFESRVEIGRTEELAHQRLELSLRSVNAHLQNLYERHMRAVEQLARTAAPPGAPLVAHDELNERVREVAEFFPAFHAVYVADRDGTAIAFEPERDARGAPTRGTNFRDRDYYQEMARTRRPVISAAFLGRGATDVPTQAICAPILRGSEWLGYVCGGLNLGRVEEHLRRETHNTDLQLTVLDRKGQVIASTIPNVKPLALGGLDESQLSPTSQAGLSLLAPTEVIPLMLRFQRASYIATLTGNEVQPWRIIAQAPVAPYIAGLHRAFIDNLALALGIACAVLLLARLVIARATQPIARLAQLSGETPEKLVQDGAIDWPSSEVLEVEGLVNNLKKMSARLQRAFSDQREHAARLSAANAELEREITHRRQSEAALRKTEHFLREHNRALLELAHARTDETRHADAAFRHAAETAARTLGTTRASIWLFDEAHTKIVCQDLFEATTGQHSAGHELLASNYPSYFAALATQRVIAADDARQDPRTREFAADYLTPLEITAMLDAPIWVGGRMVGVVCHEHTGTRRTWSTEEETFAGSIADVIALAIEERDRAAAQRALAQSEERYRRIVDTAREGIWLVDANYRTTYVNRRMAELFGYTPEEMLGREVREFVFPEDQGTLAGQVATRKRGEPGHYDFRYRRKDGSEVWVLSSIAPIFDEKGNFTGALGMFTDISERRQAERERAQLLERERAARAEAEILLQTGQTVAAELDLARLLQIVTDAATESAKAQIGVFARDDATHAGAMPPCTISLRSSDADAPRPPDLIAAASTIGVANGVVRLADMSDAPAAARRAGDRVAPSSAPTLRSFLAVPVKSRSGALLGQLFFGHALPDMFSDREERLVTGLAAHAAIAIDNANLFQAAQLELQQRKKTEEELRRREQELEHQSRLTSTITDNASASLFLLDAEGRCTYVNPAAEQATGFARGQLLGQPLRDFVQPAAEPAARETLFDRLPAAERIVNCEGAFRRSDGSEFPVMCSASPIVRDGQQIGTVVEVRDITEEKRSRAALLDAQQRLQQHADELEQRVAERTARLQEAVGQMEAFSYTISHDLRAPLRAIIGFGEILEEDFASQLADEPKRHIGRMVAGARRMDKLIEDVLTYSRVSRSQLTLGRIDLGQLVSEIVAQYPALHDARVALRVDHPLLPVVGNEAFLTQCISNLLGNAVKFSSRVPQPEVRVRTEGLDGRVRLWIEDNGVGIDPRYHQKIFEMFERVHQQDGYEGTGVGLAIVQKSAERMGGRVGVDSRPGEGSRFWVELPRAD